MPHRDRNLSCHFSQSSRPQLRCDRLGGTARTPAGESAPTGRAPFSTTARDRPQPGRTCSHGCGRDPRTPRARRETPTPAEPPGSSGAAPDPPAAGLPCPGPSRPRPAHLPAAANPAASSAASRALPAAATIARARPPPRRCLSICRPGRPSGCPSAERGRARTGAV